MYSILDSSLKPGFGKTPVGDITKADIMAFRAKLAKRRGRGTTGLISPKTINSHMTILRTVLDEAAERFDFESPYKNIKPLKLRKTYIEPFSLQEVQRIIDNVRPDYRSYYMARFFTGMRTGEIDGLKWKHVDFAAREILVRETLITGTPPGGGGQAAATTPPQPRRGGRAGKHPTGHRLHVA